MFICELCGHTKEPIPTYDGSPWFSAIASCKKCKEEGRKSYLTFVDPPQRLPFLTQIQTEYADRIESKYSVNISLKR